MGASVIAHGTSSPAPTEEGRLEALRRYADSATGTEEALDDLVALASRLCETPFALITFVDAKRQWVKASIGLPTGDIPRQLSFCGQAILQSHVFVVPDVAKDERFAGNPLVTRAPFVRFYAGAPLLTREGHALGILCVLDRVPRLLSSLQEEALRVLARQVMAQLELGRKTSDLAESESRLRMLTDNARVGLVIVNREHQYVFANRVYAEILGLPSPDIVGLQVSDVLHAVYEEQIRPRLDRAFAGERLGYELHTPNAKGGGHYAVRYEPTVVDGAVTQVSVVITDVSERRHAEAASSRLAAIVESSTDAIIGKDLNGIVTSWNCGAEKLFGYTAEEMVSESITRLIPDNRRDEEVRILEKLRRGEEVEHFETERHTKDGRLIDVAITASPIRDPTGAIIGASKVARDISERRRADEERRLQQTMLATERELTLDGILVVDAHGRVLSFNGRFSQIWGIPAEVLSTRSDEVLLGVVIDKLQHPEKFLGRVRDLYDRHDEFSQDQVELKDGRVLDRYSAPMRDPGDRYYGRVWYFRDVTERRQAEAALRHERDRAQQYLDAAEVILLALDLDGRVTLINRKGCDILGWTEAELLGRSWGEVCVPERMRASLEGKFESLLRGDFSVVVNPVVMKTGEERLIEWRNRTLLDDDGRVIGTFSSGADVTERYAAVEALRAAEERMRFALQNADVGIWDMDYTTGVLRWSEILETHYGLAPGTFAGTVGAFMQCVHPGDRATVQEAFEKAEKSGADFSVQNRTIWPDGTVRWLSGAGRIRLDERGDPLRGVGIFLDVTAHRTLEGQYHQAQKMEAIGRLAGGVAHDFNNILTVILLNTELLLADRTPDDPDRADIAEIQRAATSAAELTRRLLTFSRKEIIEPTILDVNSVISDMLAMLQRLIGEDVQVAVHLRPSLSPVKADRGQIEQIVMNLVVNARDAMPGGGSLTIETANVELDDDHVKTHLDARSGPHVALTITDTGTGMTPEVQARLFEPFFTTKEVGKGTGLGLATVHGIVVRSAGSIGVHSELGRGTSFKVYLPSAAHEGVAGSVPPPSRARAGGETVLVVEDSEGLRDLAKRILERRGFRVLTAANAAEAVRLFEQNRTIDVLLTDVVMPGTSGPALSQQLVDQRPELTVIYMSGYTEDAITHHGVLKPGIEFLHKPFTAETLARKISDALGRRAPK